MVPGQIFRVVNNFAAKLASACNDIINNASDTVCGWVNVKRIDDDAVQRGLRVQLRLEVRPDLEKNWLKFLPLLTGLQCDQMLE